MKSWTDISLDYELTLDAAMPLRFWAHWLIGGLFAVVCFFISEPSQLLANPSAILLAFVFFGFLCGVISQVIVMHLIPAPYAWLAKRLGLVSPSA
jgi:hypothetical protein